MSREELEQYLTQNFNQILQDLEEDKIQHDLIDDIYDNLIQYLEENKDKDQKIRELNILYMKEIHQMINFLKE